MLVADVLIAADRGLRQIGVDDLRDVHEVKIGEPFAQIIQEGGIHDKDIQEFLAFVDLCDLHAACFMLLDQRAEIHTDDAVCAAHQNVIRRLLIVEETGILDNVPEQELAVSIAFPVDASRQHEHAVGLPSESPGFTGTDMVDQGTVFERNDESHGGDAGIGHVGQREIDQTVSSAEGKSSQRPVCHNGVHCFTCIVCCN